MTATGPEASVVARRILQTHIPDAAFGGYTVDRTGTVEITVIDETTLTKTRVALKFNNRQGSGLANRWAGVVDDIDVVLILDIPTGVFPPRQMARAAA